VGEAPIVVPWRDVQEGDRVAGADGFAWTVIARKPWGDQVKITIERAGRSPVTRTDPPGSVQVVRGPWGAEVAAAVEVFRGCGFRVD
jgi:hypothetical protein